MPHCFRWACTASLGLLLTVFAGCTSGEETTTPTTPPPPLSNEPTASPLMPEGPATPDTLVSGIGTVQYVGLEGGFYAIVDRDTERRYVPRSLPEDDRIDGLAVRFRLRLKPNQPSFRMWGIPAEIISLERVLQTATD